MNRGSVDALLRLAKARIVLYLGGDIQTLDSGGIVVSDLAGKVRIFGERFLDLDHCISIPVQVYQVVYVHDQTLAPAQDRQQEQRAGSLREHGLPD
jgi:hypothetical protein